MKKVILFFIILISTNLFSQELQLERIEPPFWWKDMHNPELQIMLYGENIAQCNCKITPESVKLIDLKKTNNPNYLFIYLEIPYGFSKDVINIQFQINGKTVESMDYEIRDRMTRSSERMGFNSSDVIYLITPDRFANGSAENDINEDLGDILDRKDPQARHGGDLKGIINNLDYLEDMGFTAIWLNPVLENAMPRTSYHGYATTDYYKIDPRYGTMNDYITLSKEAEKRGIKLIMDQILNHCGSKHWWMSDLPDTNWFNDKDKYQITNHRRTVISDPYASKTDKEKFIRGWFVDQMPDLNGDHPLLRDYMVQNSIWWVEAANLGGIRHDTHCYPGADFMSAYTCRVMDEYPNFNMVGEEWTENPIIVSKWQRNNKIETGINSCIPSMMDFPLQATLVRSLNQEENWNTGLNNLYELIACDYIYPNPANLVIFPDNHDMDRYFTQVNENIDLFKMGLVYMATIRGIPQIYYGTEILMSNGEDHSHGVIRSDFPGGWEKDTKNAFNGQNLSKSELDAQNFLKALLNWRKSNKTVQFGQLMHYAPNNGLYVYFRYDQDKKVMIVLNKDNNSRSLNYQSYPEMLSLGNKAINVFSNEVKTILELSVPGRSATIFEIE